MVLFFLHVGLHLFGVLMEFHLPLFFLCNMCSRCDQINLCEEWNDRQLTFSFHQSILTDNVGCWVFCVL